MGGTSKQEREFTKRTPTNGNESLGRRAEQNFVFKACSTETHDKTQSWPLLPSKSLFITTTPQNNQENHNFDPFSKFNCAKY